MLPDTLCRNELARVKCVAPSLQIMAPWPSPELRAERERAERESYWNFNFVAPAPGHGRHINWPISIAVATVTSADTMRAVDTYWRNFTCLWRCCQSRAQFHLECQGLEMSVSHVWAYDLFSLWALSSICHGSCRNHPCRKCVNMCQIFLRLLLSTSSPQLRTGWPDKDKEKQWIDMWHYKTLFAICFSSLYLFISVCLSLYLCRV